MNSKTKSRWLLMFTAGLLAASASVIVLAILHITPFGNNNLLISDMGAQYNAFLTAWRHMLASHHITLYTFSQGLGSNFVPTMAYYLLSPFNLLLLLGKSCAVPVMVSWLLILKITLIAMTMTYFLSRHFNTTNKMLIVFALAFSLCGFVTISYFNIMWLDSLIWLPLVIDGVDQLLINKQIHRLFWWLTISIITNFYLGYMTCLFVGLYTIYQLFELRLPTWRANVTTLLSVIGVGCLAALTSCVVLLPTALGMLQTAKTVKPTFSFLPEYGLDIINQLGVGATNYQSHLVHAPAVFCTTFVALLVLFFWFNYRISQSHKIHAGIFLLVLLLTINMQFFNNIWHLGSQPAGFPFRNVFMISFMMIIWGWESWQAGITNMANIWRYLLPIGLSILMVIGWLSSNQITAANYNTSHVPTTSLVISIVYVGLIALVMFWQKQQLLQFLVVSEVMCNWLLTMHLTPFGNQTAYEHLCKTQQHELSAQHVNFKKFTRVNVTNTLLRPAYRETYNNYNEGLLFNYNGLASYSSTLNNNTRLAESALGLFSRNVRRISGEGLNPVSELVFNVGRTINLHDNGAAYLNNQNACGLGVVIPQAVTTMSLSNSNLLNNQQRLLQNWQPNLPSSFAPVTIISDQVSKCGQCYRHQVVLRTNATGHVYLNATHNAVHYSSLKINGHHLEIPIYANDYRFLCDLGSYQANQTFTMAITTHRATLHGLDIASLNQDTWQKFLQQVKQQGTYQPRLQWHNGEPVFTSTMTNHSNNHWLLLSLPYEPGWQFTVNQHQVVPKKVLNGLTALKINTGKNKITIKYHVPGLRLGMIMSLCGLLIYLIWSIIIKKATA